MNGKVDRPIRLRQELLHQRDECGNIRGRRDLSDIGNTRPMEDRGGGTQHATDQHKRKAAVQTAVKLPHPPTLGGMICVRNGNAGIAMDEGFRHGDEQCKRGNSGDRTRHEDSDLHRPASVHDLVTHGIRGLPDIEIEKLRQPGAKSNKAIGDRGNHTRF